MGIREVMMISEKDYFNQIIQLEKKRLQKRGLWLSTLGIASLFGLLSYFILELDEVFPLLVDLFSL